MTNQTNIAIQIVATLSPEEMQHFKIEFDKLYIPTSTSKPKKVKTSLLPSPQILAQQALAEHRAKHKNIPDASKLA